MDKSTTIWKPVVDTQGNFILILLFSCLSLQLTLYTVNNIHALEKLIQFLPNYKRSKMKWKLTESLTF
uniref:Uncharacterized protein n=1 Tax=Arundo donax TaxID=35708 RepID=A0A0A8Z1D4_ARUDO